jgi:MFS family permease
MSGPASDARAGELSGRARWTLMICLLVAAVLSFVDRQILSLLVEPIKADFGVSDSQIALLQGVAFAVFYSIAAVPFGWLSDRVSRKWLVVAGVFAWSLMTVLSGLARSFLALFCARIGVGVGEATLAPAAHSMIADAFPAERMPLAMSVYGMGVAIGAGLAFILGGQVVAWAMSGPPLILPGLEPLKPWHTAFIAVGAPGLLAAVLMAVFMREPARRHEPSKAVGSIVSFARANAGLLALMVLGLGCLTASGYASLAWLAAFFERTFGWGADRAGLAIGSLLIFAGLPGALACGAVAARLASQGANDAALTTMAVASAVSAPFAALAFLAPSPLWSIVWLIVPMAIGSSYVGLGPAALQAITPSALRGRMAAWQLLLTGLIGMIVGPLSVALLTDLVFQDEARLNWSLAVASPVLTLIGAAALWAARRRYAVLNQSVPEKA